CRCFGSRRDEVRVVGGRASGRSRGPLAGDVKVLEPDLVPAGEKLVEEAVAERAPGGDVDPVDDELPVPLVGHQAGVPEDGEVVAGVALGQPELLAELA